MIFTAAVREQVCSHISAVAVRTKQVRLDGSSLFKNKCQERGITCAEILLGRSEGCRDPPPSKPGIKEAVKAGRSTEERTQVREVFHGDQTWGCAGGSAWFGSSIFWPGLIEKNSVFPESQLIWSNALSLSSILTFSTSAVQLPLTLLPFLDHGNYINLWLLTRNCCATSGGCVQYETPRYSVSSWEESTVRTWHKTVPASPSIHRATCTVIFPPLAAGFTPSTCLSVTARRWFYAARFNLPVLSYIIDCQKR